MNIEEMTAKELISELMQLAILSYKQYCLYHENSIEQQQILQAQQLPARLLVLLQEAQEDYNATDLQEATLSYAKEQLLKEQNIRLNNAQLSQQFIKGELACTARA